MSICSTASDTDTPSFDIVSSNGYKLLTTTLELKNIFYISLGHAIELFKAFRREIWNSMAGTVRPL
jgi:hypothetical protein